MRGGALSEEDADSDRFGAGFLQGFNLAEADKRGKFVAFADDAFGGGGSAFHGTGDDVLRDFFQVVFDFGVRVSSCVGIYLRSFTAEDTGETQRKFSYPSFRSG